MKNDSTELVFFVEQKSFFQRKRALIKLLMRISAINIFILSLSAGAFAYSIDGKGQSIENTTVELEFVNAPLKAVFAAIEAQTEFSFVVPLNEVDVKHRVSLQAGTYTVKDALDLVLKGTGIGFEQTGDYVILSPNNEEKEIPDDKRSENEAGKSEKDVRVALITGTVKNASTNEPMAGVNIIVKGTLKGTTTDVEGKFAIDAVDRDILVFSFIGFKTFETSVSTRMVIDVTMEEDVSSLQEVVVNAGYYSTTDKTRTGNIAKVSGREIEDQPVSNVLQALQGRMPGVEIVQHTGAPGAAMKIQIRGQNSLRAVGNFPLYIVDGVPIDSSPITSLGDMLFTGTDPLNTINPSNIESVEILKDADATAIYGSRGANGVVLITTKKGKTGMTVFDIEICSGVGKVSNMLELLNTKEYLKMRKEAFLNDGVNMTTTNARDLLVWDTTRFTNWQKELFGGTANVNNIQGAISGGSDNTSFRLGGGVYRQTTVFPGDFSYQKVMGSLNLNHSTANKKFMSTISISYGSDINKSFDSDLMDEGLRLAPTAPTPYDGDGNLNWENNTWINPLSYLKKEHNSTSYNLVANSVVSYEVLEGVSLKTNLGYTMLNNRDHTVDPIESYIPSFRSFTTGSNTYGNDTRISWIIEPQLGYISTKGSGRFEALSGLTLQENTRSEIGINGTGYTSDAFLDILTAAPSRAIVRSGDVKYRYIAAFGRISYNWKEKYLINATGRRDGSSRFGPDNRFGNFGAIGIAWIFTNERFIQNKLTFLSFGKIRGSFGTTGSDQIGDYGYLDSYTATSSNQGTTTLSPTSLFNPDYAWEVNKKLEAAIELGLVQDRIRLSISWYRNRSSNQLVGYSLPTITGFSSIQNNLPAIVQNTGLEFQVNTVNKQAGNFRWISSLNLTIPRNKLVDYPNISGSSYANSLVVGEPITITKVYHMTGIDPQTGIYQFQDFDGNGTISSLGDRPIVKNIGRDFYGGIMNTVHYGNWELDFLLEFVKQQNFSRPGLFALPGAMSNQPKSIMNRWQSSGEASNTQRFSQQSSSNFSNAYFFFLSSDANMADASFIRMKTISVTYRIPSSFAKRIRIQESKLFLQAQNLFTLTSFSGFDPQNPGGANLPALRMITGGIQFKF